MASEDVVQKLHDQDYANRIEFACDELDRIAGDPMHLEVLIFSDEENFYLDGDTNQNPEYNIEFTSQTTVSSMY